MTAVTPRTNACLRAPGIARTTGYFGETPFEAQRVFLMLDQLEAFYGGSASPGKSSGLLMGALQFVDVPGYAALLLRRTYTDLALPGAIMDRASLWLRDTDARWNNETHTWTFPSEATLTFGHLESANPITGTHLRYQSSEFQYIGWDELTQFPEHQYRFMFTRLRRSEKPRLRAPDGLTLDDIPLRMRSASNPAPPYIAWVRRRFVDDRTREPDVAYLPAYVDDNPHVNTQEYEASLKKSDPVTYARLRFGDWEAKDPGAVFDVGNFRIEEHRWPNDRRYRRCRRWDLASTEVKPGNDPDFTAGVLLCLDCETGLWRIEDVTRVRKEPHDVEALLARTAAVDGREVPIVIEQEPGASGKSLISHLARNVLRGYRVEGDRVTGPKEARIRMVAPCVARGEVSVVPCSGLGEFFDEVDAYPNGDHDDQCDAWSGAHAWLSSPTGRVLV